MSGAFPFFWRNDMRRPVNPVIPYPPEAVQHTRCVLALSMITVALSLLKSETLPQHRGGDQFGRGGELGTGT